MKSYRLVLEKEVFLGFVCWGCFLLLLLLFIVQLKSILFDLLCVLIFDTVSSFKFKHGAATNTAFYASLRNSKSSFTKVNKQNMHHCVTRRWGAGGGKTEGTARGGRGWRGRSKRHPRPETTQLYRLCFSTQTAFLSRT